LQRLTPHHTQVGELICDLETASRVWKSGGAAKRVKQPSACTGCRCLQGNRLRWAVANFTPAIHEGVQGVNRRIVLGGLVAGSAALAAGAFVKSAIDRNASSWAAASGTSNSVKVTHGGMKYRKFGKTGMTVSEVGFGGWGIGGQAYGTVDRSESLRALARAEELGCNFIDTGMRYGDSELVIGEFLGGRRSHWLVATKFSGQPQGIEATIEQQLLRLRVEAIDFYQIHWAPSKAEHELYEALYRVKKAGKARYVGVSLNTIADIDYVLKQTDIDGFQVPFSLLDPDPFIAKLHLIREKGVGVIVRSSLKEGFLTGKYNRDVVFPDPNDQRHKWSREQIAQTVDAAEQFRFLEKDVGSMMVGAASYPLSFNEVSTLILGTKSVKQADTNFGVVPGTRLSDASLMRIQEVQREMRAFKRKDRIIDAIHGLLS
jgi:aryl-alcohol dehydrogenase-like predicted oxidoreductase